MAAIRQFIPSREEPFDSQKYRAEMSKFLTTPFPSRTIEGASDSSHVNPRMHILVFILPLIDFYDQRFVSNLGSTKEELSLAVEELAVTFRQEAIAYLKVNLVPAV